VGYILVNYLITNRLLIHRLELERVIHTTIREIGGYRHLRETTIMNMDTCLHVEYRGVEDTTLEGEVEVTTVLQ